MTFRRQVWMWYLSVTLLVIMVTFLTIRCLVFFFAWIAGYEFWILPRLFDETLAFAESFTPVSSAREYVLTSYSVHESPVMSHTRFLHILEVLFDAHPDEHADVWRFVESCLVLGKGRKTSH